MYLMMNIKKLDCGSARSGPLADGCKYCMRGSKMVLFITGKCKTNCYYCPISFEKKGEDAIYANELRISSINEILNEAESMDAEGTGITGGDPLFDVSRTVAVIKLLKDFFGKSHHIHLYTSTIDSEKVNKLVNAGLDEIRFHPPVHQWEKVNCSTLEEIVKMNVDVGIEVPALPDHEKELSTLLSYASEIDVKFINLNELEFSESNWDMMSSHNYDIKNETSAAVNNSEETALRMMKKHSDISIHYCSSGFKDSIQLRKRLIRKANRIAKKYDLVTEDGTILKGYACPENLEDARLLLVNEYDVPDELIFIDRKNNRLEIAPWVLEDIAEDLSFECYISEQYPTADGLEVERIPLNR